MSNIFFSSDGNNEDQSNTESTKNEIENTEDKSIQTNSKSERSNSKKEDEFKRELDKMIKEKEKRDKKQEKREKKEMTLALKQLEKEKMESDGSQKRRGSTSSEDPRIGTLTRLSAIFKFSKLNARSRRGSSYEVEQMELLNRNFRKSYEGNSDAGSLLSQEGNSNETKASGQQTPNHSQPELVPPPLPPKPSLNSPVRKSLGTRVINV